MTDENPYAAPDPRFGPPPAPANPYAPPPTQPQGQPAQYPPPWQGPPPPYQTQYPPAYQAQYAPQFRAPHVFRGNQGLGVAMLILGAAYVLALVLQAATAPGAIDAYDRAVREGRDPGLVATPHDLLGLLFVVMVPLWIVGSLWTHRAYSNARALVPANMHRSAVWCWLGWVVPIVSYWFPKQIVDDSWQTTAHHLPPGSKGRRRSTALWWGLWVAFIVVNGFTLRFGLFASASSSPTGVAPANVHQGVRPGVEALLAVLAVAAYAAWVPVVVGVSRAQEELKARLSPRPF